MKVDIFAASLKILYCRCSSLISSFIVIITLFILSQRLSLKRKESSDARGVLLNKKEYGFTIHFL